MQITQFYFDVIVSKNCNNHQNNYMYLVIDCHTTQELFTLMLQRNSEELSFHI